jgi:hypothetical protein
MGVVQKTAPLNRSQKALAKRPSKKAPQGFDAKSNLNSLPGNKMSRPLSHTTSSNSIEKVTQYPGWKVSSKKKPYAVTWLESVTWQHSMFVTIGQYIGRPPIHISKIGMRLPRRVENSENCDLPETSRIT